MVRWFLRVILWVLLFPWPQALGQVVADTHYVSLTGSNLFPYTSWATAALKIQDAVNASDSGDAVLVDTGRYQLDTTLTLKPHILLRGKGMDSTIILSVRDLNWAIAINPGDTVEHLWVKAAIGSGAGFHDIYSDLLPSFFVRNCKVTDFDDGMNFGFSRGIISNNLLVGNDVEIDVCCDGIYLIENNTLIHAHAFNAINAAPGLQKGFIQKNFIILKEDPFGNKSTGINIFFDADTAIIRNNIITSPSPNQPGVLEGMLVDLRVLEVQNNTISNLSHDGLARSIGIDMSPQSAVPFRVVNNIIDSANVGVSILQGHGTVAYNDFWRVLTQDIELRNGAILDTNSGNITRDPMFVDSLDFHLQKHSPCIDAGHPGILDPDGSRSDIGAFGGLLGETYIYQDLPPKAPQNLRVTFADTVLVLQWQKNAESDLAGYLLFKDSVPGFPVDSSHLLSSLSPQDSTALDFSFRLGGSYYYRLVAFDNALQASTPSNEASIIGTPVAETHDPNLPRVYSLSQNYPNPFNPSTVLEYTLPDVGAQPAPVRLVIYNLLGQAVRTLVDQKQHPGRYRTVWDGRDDQGKDLPSGIYFAKLLIYDVALTKPTKMVLVR